MTSDQRRRFSEASIAALPIDGHDRIVFEARTEGFGVRVTPAGTKIFIAQARVGGRPRRIAVGRHPDVSVATARADARVVLEALRAGRDPKAEQAARARELEAGQMTVAALAMRWLAEHVELKLKPRTAADYRLLVEQRIDPELGHLVISKVTKDHVLKFHAGMSKTPRRANYAVSTFRSLMSFAEDVGLRPPMSNPARKIKMYREGRRERFLSEPEIAKAAEAIALCEREGVIGPHAAAGLRLALLTGARSGEVTAIKWTDIDRQRRQIRLADDGDEPGRKSGARTIYLNDAAIEVLNGVPRLEPFVIAGAKAGQPYKNLSRAWEIVRAKAGLDDVRLHDLRHSFASLAASKGHSLLMIGKLLGHRVPSTTQRYAHLTRDAASAVADELGGAIATAIAEAPRAGQGTVVKLKPRRRR
jgi:integrase